MQCTKRLRVLLGLAFALALLCVGGVWWLAVGVRLSPAEQRMVGAWEYRHAPAPGAPSGYVKVWRFAPDRSVRIEAVDSGGLPLGTLAGRWRLQGESLVCDWEGSAAARAGRFLPARWTGVTDTKLDRYWIESADGEEVRLRPRGGPAVYALRRVAGE